MDSDAKRFQDYLTNNKGLSANSVSAYLRDTAEFATFLEEKGVHAIDDASRADMAAWLLGLKSRGMSAATVNRKLASMRAYFRYAIETGRTEADPTTGIKSPRITRKGIEYLSIEEVERLLTAPGDTDIGRRDLAILEMLYATGLRVTELMFVNIDDVNLRMGFVTCSGAHGKARIIPIGRPARAALEAYIYDIRPHLQRGKTAAEARKESALFLNYYGERITRQALWKILKSYSEKAGIDKKITPQILRNSFAVHMVQNGADLNTLQELMGHEDPVATQAYLSVTKNRIKDVYDSAHPRA
ncbi:tyrosine recombinase XerD [Clostridia bacterium]|nr:tyrosine recombinase XerD [Clostridia bacterium]